MIFQYRSLDHWRGLAAVWVLIFHGFHGMEVHSSIQWLAWLADWGWFGVHLFFVISGFCITANVLKLQGMRLGAWAFLKDRMLRIYPVYWAAILFSLIIAVACIPLNHTTFAHNVPTDAKNWLANIILAQPFCAVEPILVVSWSLVYELLFYGLVAGAFQLYRLGVSAVVIIFCLGLLSFLGLKEWPPGWGYLLNFWPEFFVGGICYLTLAFRRRAVLLWLFPVTLLALELWFQSGRMKVVQMAGALLFGLLLTGLFRYDCWLANWRFLRWLGWLGIISYSLYLIHVPVTGRVVNFLGRYVTSDSPWQIFVQVAGWSAGIFMARGFYCLVEKPLNDWRKKPSQLSAPHVSVRKIS